MACEQLLHKDCGLKGSIEEFIFFQVDGKSKDPKGEATNEYLETGSM
jgi:hypothetical protein